MGGEPHIFVRMMALKDKSQVKSCVYTALTWGVLTSAGALLLGLLAYAIYGDLDIFVNDREKVFPFMVKAFTPPFLAWNIIGRCTLLQLCQLRVLSWLWQALQ